MPVKIAIVEDDLAQAERLQKYLCDWSEKSSVICDVRHFADGAFFLDAKHSDFDVVFMDVAMPTINGIETAKELRKTDSVVLLVFITSLKQFALNGYQVDAMDYLLKPVAYPQFATLMDRIARKLSTRQESELVLQNKEGFFRVSEGSIYYIDILYHFITYHTTEGDFRFWGNLSDEERRLTPGHFARCSSAYLVNLKYVRKIEDDMVCVGQTKLPVSRGKKNSFMNALLGYLSGSIQPGKGS